MNTFLDILYTALHSNMSSPEEEAILKREEAFLDEMEQRLGQKDFNHFWDTVSELGCCRAAADFQLGFAAGANFAMTVKTPVFPQ